jgi:hypothetical protein
MKKPIVNISKGFKLVIYSLVVFFMFLAILEGYGNQEVQYDNIERIDEAGLNFLDITHQITRPSFRKVSKFERVQSFSIHSEIYKRIGILPQFIYFKKAIYYLKYTFESYLIAFSNYTNAP